MSKKDLRVVIQSIQLDVSNNEAEFLPKARAVPVCGMTMETGVL